MIAAKAAPAMNVADGPTAVHNVPAITLARRSAPPATRLKIPNAAPRNLAGAVSATSFDNRPCVIPMCSP